MRISDWSSDVCSSDLRVTEACVEAEIAQDTQMILGDALQGIADEAHAARGKIVEPAEIVEQGARQRIGVDRVDREIAPRLVVAPDVGIIDDRVAAFGGNEIGRASCRERVCEYV